MGATEDTERADKRKGSHGKHGVRGADTKSLDCKWHRGHCAKIAGLAYFSRHGLRLGRISAQFQNIDVGADPATSSGMILLHSELTEQIIGVYHDVHSELGCGFLEKICQSAMVIALRAAGLTVDEHPAYPVFFRGHMLGEFCPDIIVNGIVLVEIKSKSGLVNVDEAQAINYLRVSPVEVALILNFGPKREYWRRILTNDRKQPCIAAAAANMEKK